jgi:hypothetical protein
MTLPACVRPTLPRTHPRAEFTPTPGASAWRFPYGRKLWSVYAGGIARRQHQQFLASRAAVGEKVGLGLYRMGLTANQPHQATAARAKKGCQALCIAYVDVFHGPKVGPC